MELKEWWEQNGSLGISACEFLYRQHNKPCGHFSKTEFRQRITEFRQNNSMGEKVKIVQINDLHIPFHDKQTISVFFKFLKDFKPDQVVIAGDMLDFYELSSFDKDPKRKFCIQDEIDQCYDFLKEILKYCQDIHFIKGNHEDRLRRFLWKNPSLASIKVLELPSLLNLDTLGVKYHDYEYVFRNFRFTHGSIVRQESGLTAKAEQLKYGSSMASGHTHRIGMYIKTDSRGTIGAYEGGCLCDLHPEYINGTPNWQQGFIVYNFIKDRFFAQLIPIIDHKFIYGDKKYE